MDGVETSGGETVNEVAEGVLDQIPRGCSIECRARVLGSRYSRAMSRRGPLEKDTCRDVVLPMLELSGWSSEKIVPEYVVRAANAPGNRDPLLGDGRVDYVLEAVPGVPVAVVEAKREYSEAADGLAQAIRYAQQLGVSRAYATNGREIIERDLRTGHERSVTHVPPPSFLWSEYAAAHGLLQDGAGLLAGAFNRGVKFASGDAKLPRWYQTVAVQEVLAAIARGERRVLLLMATGTGKTFTAMQIVHKLRSWNAIVRPARNYRVLFLADLDVLLTQPERDAFRPAFGEGPLKRVKGTADFNREIYFASYQAMSGQGTDETELFRDYPPDFFDLVVVDECHRGSAASDSSWRRVLDHFTSAVHLGLTATPKQDDAVDTLDYFGTPVFTYTLRQGIGDGFLAPYRVRRVILSPDADGWQPDQGQLDRFGRDIPEGIYSTRDFERVVSLLARTDLAANHISGILRRQPTARTMVFCVDQQHAEDMRAALVRLNPDLVVADPEWAVRIVGSEPDRVRLLEAFCDAERDSPVVATTSKLLSTGVDVEDLKYVVLFRPIGSAIEFKQIVGRGTRLFPKKGKTSFEIVDYVGATSHFTDRDFDGYPTETRVQRVDDDGQVVADSGSDVSPGDEVVAEPTPEFEAQRGDVDDAAPPRSRYVVEDGNFSLVAEAVMVADTSSGRLVLTEYGEYVADQIKLLAGSPAELSKRWSAELGRAEVRRALEAEGVAVADLLGDGSDDTDPLDVLIRLAWNVAPQTRSERVRRVREQHRAELDELSDAARAVLGGLLERYAAHGVEDITSGEVLRLPPLAGLGTPVDIARVFGGAEGFHAQIDTLQRWLYSA